MREPRELSRRAPALSEGERGGITPLSTSSPELTKLLDDFTTAIHVYNESKTDRGPRALVEGAFKLQAIVAARSAIELSFATLTEEIKRLKTENAEFRDEMETLALAVRVADEELKELRENAETDITQGVQDAGKIGRLLSDNERLRATALTPEEAAEILEGITSRNTRDKLRLISETPK